MVVGTRVAPEDAGAGISSDRGPAGPEAQHEGDRDCGGGRMRAMGKNQVHPAPPAAPAPAALALPAAARPAAWEVAPHEQRLEANGEVFIPFRVAKTKVSEVENDMRTLRGKHLRIIEQVEGHYKVRARPRVFRGTRACTCARARCACCRACATDALGRPARRLRASRSSTTWPTSRG